MGDTTRARHASRVHYAKQRAEKAAASLKTLAEREPDLWPDLLAGQIAECAGRALALIALNTPEFDQGSAGT